MKDNSCIDDVIKNNKQLNNWWIYDKIDKLDDKFDIKSFILEFIHNNNPHKKIRDSYLRSAKEEITEIIGDYVENNGYSPAAQIKMNNWCSALDETLSYFYRNKKR